MALRRGVGVVLAILFVASAVSLGGLVLLGLLVGREPAVPSDATVVLRLSGDIEEGGPGETIGQFLPGRRAPSVRTIVENLQKAEADPRVKNVLVMPLGFSTPYWAKLQEVRDAIADFRKSGKRAIAHLEYGGQAEYLVAAACDRVYLVPTSPLDLSGLASYEVFLRGTLDKIGAYPDFLHVGAFKTAPNQLTETTFTKAHREMAESLTRDLYEQLLRGVADGRRKSESEVRQLIDEGPFLPEDALRAGLVDDLAYEDQVRKQLGAGAAADRRIDLHDYDRVRPRGGLGRAARIAVVYATGTIMSGASGFDPFGGQMTGSETIATQLRKIREDESIRAVIVRVDSPGGSAVASDVIWRELTLTRDATPRKPLVASMSDLAASGGYYIAMAAPTIVAEPGTLTGSIGIYGGKLATGGTYGKLGMNVEAVSAGRHAEMNSPVRPFTESERVKLAEQLQAFYDQFVEKAARARRMAPERLDQIAQGRVWTGRQAKSLGLVDALGGLETAVTLAKQQAGIAPTAPVELVTYPPRLSLYDLIASTLGARGQALDAGLRTLGLAPPGAGAMLAPATLFRRGEPLALCPLVFLR